MHPTTRAGLAAVLVFWALCSLFFVQPFTGSFLLVAIPAAAMALLLFVALRSRPAPREDDGSGPAGGALVVGVALVLLGLMFAVGRWPMLWDPCHTWDDDSTSSSSSPDDPCSSSSYATQSRNAFLLESLAGEVTLMAGGALAIWGSRRRSRLVLAAAGVAMLLPTAILFRGLSMSFIVAFLLGVVLVLMALLMPSGRRLEGPPPSA